MGLQRDGAATEHRRGARRRGVDATTGSAPRATADVVVDEGSSLLTPNKASKEMAGVQLQIGDRLTRISMAGRAVGVHLLLAAQRPDVQNLGPSGGQLRMNMDVRAAVCSIDGDGKRMMFDGLDDPDILRTLDGTKGRTVLAKLQAGSMDAFPAQTIYQNETDLLDAPPKVRVLQLGAHQRPLHIDVIGRDEARRQSGLTSTISQWFPKANKAPLCLRSCHELAGQRAVKGRA